MKKLKNFSGLLLVVALLIAAFPPRSQASVGMLYNGARRGTATDLNIKGCAVSGEGTVLLDCGTLNGGTIDNVVIGGTTPAAGSFTNVTATPYDAATNGTDTNGRYEAGVTVQYNLYRQYVTILPQYLTLYAFTASLRPASGAPPGAFITVKNATTFDDCGTAGGGSSFAVCISNGSNWIPLDRA